MLLLLLFLFCVKFFVLDTAKKMYVRTYCTVHSNALHVADRRPPDHDVERFDDRRGCWKMKGCDPYVQLACASVWFHEDVDELCQPCCSLG